MQAVDTSSAPALEATNHNSYSASLIEEAMEKVDLSSSTTNDNAVDTSSTITLDCIKADNTATSQLVNNVESTSDADSAGNLNTLHTSSASSANGSSPTSPSVDTTEIEVCNAEFLKHLSEQKVKHNTRPLNIYRPVTRRDLSLVMKDIYGWPTVNLSTLDPWIWHVHLSDTSEPLEDDSDIPRPADAPRYTVSAKELNDVWKDNRGWPIVDLSIIAPGDRVKYLPDPWMLEQDDEFAELTEGWWDPWAEAIARHKDCGKTRDIPFEYGEKKRGVLFQKGERVVV